MGQGETVWAMDTEVAGGAAEEEVVVVKVVMGVATVATVVATVVATTWPASRRAEAEQYISGYLHIYLCFLFVS